MGAPFWSDIEHDYFVDVILPQSRYPRGIYQEVGQTFEELASVMQKAMDQRGASRRQYTGAVLFQHWYQKCSPRSNTRGEAVTAQSPISQRNSWQRDGQTFTGGSGRSRTGSQSSSIPDPKQVLTGAHGGTSAGHFRPATANNSQDGQYPPNRPLLSTRSLSTHAINRDTSFTTINHSDSVSTATARQTDFSPSTPKPSNKKRPLEYLFGEGDDEGKAFPAAEPEMSPPPPAKKSKGGSSNNQKKSTSKVGPRDSESIKRLYAYGSPTNPSRIPSQSTPVSPSPSVSPMTQLVKHVHSPLHSHVSAGSLANSTVRGTSTHSPSRHRQQAQTYQDSGMSPPPSRSARAPTTSTSASSPSYQEDYSYSQVGPTSSVSSQVDPRRGPGNHQSPPRFSPTSVSEVGSQSTISTNKPNVHSGFHEFHVDNTALALPTAKGARTRLSACATMAETSLPSTAKAPVDSNSTSKAGNTPETSQETSQTPTFTPTPTTAATTTPATSTSDSSATAPASPGTVEQGSPSEPDKKRKAKLGAVWMVEKIMVPECPGCGRGFGYEDEA